MQQFETPRTRLRRVLIGVGLAAVSSSVSLAFPQDEAVVRWYDVRALEAAGLREPEGVDVRLPLVTSFLDDMEPDYYDVRLEEPFALTEGGVSRIVLDGLGEDWPDGDVFADERAGFLRVEGTAETQAEVERILAELNGHLLATVELEVFAIPASAIPAGTGSVLSESEADALVAGADPTDYLRTAARLGHRTLLGRESVSATLIDYDVEVASKSRATDPQVTVLYGGLSLGAVVLGRPDGGYFLRVWGRHGVPDREPRRTELESFGSAPIELPSTSSTLSVASAAIPDGGGLLLGHDWNGNGVWLIRVAATGDRSTDAEGESPFVHLGELTARPLVVAPPWLPRTHPSGGWSQDRNSFANQLQGGQDEPPVSAEDVLESLWDEREEGDLGGSLQLLGDSLYARGSAALLERARSAVTELKAALPGETVEVEVRIGLLEKGPALALVTGSEPVEYVDRLDHRLFGASRLGDSLLIVGGRESFYLQDHDVEIAEATAVGDPIVASLFEGASLWFRPSRSGKGRLSAWVDLSVHVPARAKRPITVSAWEPRNAEQSTDDPAPTGTFHAEGSIELPATSRGGVRALVDFVEGEWTLVACSAMPGTDRQLVAVAKATSQPVR